MKSDIGAGLASEDKKLLLERYGYDATEFASQSKVHYSSLLCSYLIQLLRDVESC